MPERRDVLQGLAALAAARWEADDLDPNNADEWGEFEGNGYVVGDHAPETASVTLRADHLAASLFEEDVVDATARVTYGVDGVSLSLGADGDDITGSAGLDLTTAEAKNLAASLYMAAAELEAWREAEDG